VRAKILKGVLLSCRMAALTEEERDSSQALPRDDEDEEALYGEEEDTWKKAVPEDEEEPSMKRPPEEDEPEPSISIPPPMKRPLPEADDFEDEEEEARSGATRAITGPFSSGKPPRSGKRSPVKRSQSFLGKKSPVGAAPSKERRGPAGGISPVGAGGGKGVFKAGKSRLGLERFQEKEPVSEPEEGEIKSEDSVEEGEVRGRPLKVVRLSVDDSKPSNWVPERSFGGKGLMMQKAEDAFAPRGVDLEEGEIEEGEIPAEEGGGELREERVRAPDADELRRKKKKRKRGTEEGGHSRHGDVERSEGPPPKKILLKLPGKAPGKATGQKANGKSVKRSRVSDYTDILGLKPKSEPKALTADQKPRVELPSAAYTKTDEKDPIDRVKFADPQIRAEPAHVPKAMAEDVRKKCKVVLEKLRTAKDKEGRDVAAALLQLPSEKEAPDYYRVVRTPVDLGAIEARLAGRSYPGAAEFARDVDLMLGNAQLYYKKGSQVYSDARKLQKLFFQRMQLNFPEVNLEAARGVNKREEGVAALVGASERPGVGPIPTERKPVVPSSMKVTMPGPKPDAGQAKGFRTSYAGSFNQAGQPVQGGIGKVRIRVRAGGLASKSAPRVEILPAEQPKPGEIVSGAPKAQESARAPQGAGVSERSERPRAEEGRAVHPAELVVIKKKRRSKEDGGGATPRQGSRREESFPTGGRVESLLPSESLLGFRPPKKMRSERRPAH
jgi:hypothetical protein